jgi:NAD(P)-dependent dehydrogenase (short-subunit alcohol dehydrogenase family)
MVDRPVTASRQFSPHSASGGGRVALISGAARGIGAATARVLARRGYRLSLVGLEPEALAALADELGGDHAWFEVDVTDQAQLESAVAGTVERLGGIDVVVANAGIASYGTVRQTPPHVFQRVVDINLTGAFRTVQAALPHVAERRGYLLIIASMASFTALGGLAAYCASKAGADALAGSLRQEVAHRGVAVGSAHPSWIDTDMVRDVAADLATYRRMRAMLPWPMRATTSVEECAEAIADGIERRARRIYVPRAAQIVQWLRPLLASAPAEWAVLRITGRLMPQMEAEVDSLGRSLSERVGELDQAATQR